MNIEIEKTPAFALENKVIALFKDIESLGLYTFIKMLLEQKASSLPVIIESVKNHFNLEEEYVLKKIKVIADLGVLFIAKKDK